MGADMSHLPPQTTVQGYPLRTGPGGIYVPKTIQAVRSLIDWRNAGHDTPDYWLRCIIAAAFERMTLRRMQDAPAADVIVIVAEDWLDIVGERMEQHIDQERIVTGFRMIFRECRRWPQPVDLIKRLPARILPKSPRTTEAPMSDEEHAKIAAKFAEILESLK